MWQAAAFDLERIDWELDWTAGTGFNSVREFPHDLGWQADPQGFKRRITQYLEAAGWHGIPTLFVFFDDCGNCDPRQGR
jgi:hypothetical protein